MKTNIHFWSYLTHFFLERGMFQTKVVAKIKTHILYSVIFFWKSYRLWDNVEKYCRVGQAWMTICACTLRAGCLRLQIHTIMLCNTHCFSTAPLVSWTCLTVTLHIHCLSCLYSFQAGVEMSTLTKALTAFFLILSAIWHCIICAFLLSSCLLSKILELRYEELILPVSYMKSGLSHYGMIVGWGCLWTQCWGTYLVLRGKT